MQPSMPAFMQSTSTSLDALAVTATMGMCRREGSADSSLRTRRVASNPSHTGICGRGAAAQQRVTALGCGGKPPAGAEWR